MKKVIRSFAAAFLVAQLINNTIAYAQCTPPPAGMVGWWQGEGNALDLAGINSGTVQGGNNYTTGKVGQGFGMNGSTGGVRIPTSPSLNVGAANGLTVEAWRTRLRQAV